MAESNNTKSALETSAPIIQAFVDTCLIPKLKKLNDYLSLEYKKNIIGIETYLAEYFKRMYNKYSIVNTLVFNNSEKLLKDIFIPLTLKNIERDELKYKTLGFPFDIAKSYKKILITDTAGMGKSTLVKRMFLDVVEKSVGIPMLIELRRLNKDKTILKEIHEQLNSINKAFEENLLLELLIGGDFIFFFDGFDEISLSDRNSVTKDIQEFIAKTNNNRFFITSRPESALSSFGDFQQFKIEPLEKKEAFELLKKYDNTGNISTLLIKKLNESQFNNIGEFLTNPLLISLLFTAFEYKQVIPFKKHIFYRQVYDANFESHDLTKGDSFMHDKYSCLDIDDFHKVLRHIGYSCLKIQKIEFSKDELLNLISESKVFCTGLNFKESDFLKDLISTVPLFTKDGIYYRWSHKSLQEYFAAQFIYLDAKLLQSKILEKISQGLDTDKYFNVLDLYYDIDYKSFREVIIYPALKDLKRHYEKLKKIIHPVLESDLIPYVELTFLSFFDIFILFNSIDANTNSRMESLFKEYENNNPFVGDGDRIIRSIFNNPSKHLYDLQLLNNSRFNIVLILANKKNIITKNISRNQIAIPLEQDISFLTTDIPLIIDNRTSNPIISQNLNSINKLLYELSMLDVTLDYKNSMIELESIEKEKKLQKTSNYLLNGLN